MSKPQNHQTDQLNFILVEMWGETYWASHSQETAKVVPTKWKPHAQAYTDDVVVLLVETYKRWVEIYNAQLIWLTVDASEKDASKKANIWEIF